MKLSICVAACLLAATTVLADDVPQFLIESRYEGFDSSLLKGVGSETDPGQGAVTAPRVTTKAGQRATIEIIREVPVPGGTVDGKPHVNSGVILDVSPDFKDGKITLEGSSTVRRRLDPGKEQPLGAVSFTARETFFNGEVTDGKPLVIHVGDGAKDLSRVTLTVTRVTAKIIDQEKKHAGPLNYRVYSIEPSPEDAKKPFYQGLGLVPTAKGMELQRAHFDQTLRENGVAIAGVFSPEEEAPGQAEMRRLVKDSLKEIPADQMPIKISSVLGPDGQTLNVTIQAAQTSTRKIETSVSIYWGSDILLTIADATRPGGRRGLLIEQD